MRYLALVCDYDGTIAHHGRVDDATVAALERVRASGRKLLLVTGRKLDDLMQVFPNLQVFDRIVAENGALLYDPATREERALAAAPPEDFIRALRERGVTPLSVGRIIVATWEPNDPIVHDVIRRMGLDLQVIFNKGAVMVLPSGLNKAVGLKTALDELKLSLHNAVGIGDAENDHALLAACECGVAVANALDSVKARVDWVTPSDHGAGVVELIDRLIDADLADLRDRLTRHDLVIGTATGEAVRIPAYGGVILVAGPSGSGKSTIVTALLERLCDAAYQLCVVDPEGDYNEFPGAVALRGGDAKTLAGDALQLLDRSSHNAVLTLLDMRLEDRPAFLQRLLARLLELRAATGRPHWIVIDEAHHLLPSKWQPSEAPLPAQLRNTVLVTVHPDDVAPSVLNLVDTVIVVGKEPQATIDAFAQARGSDNVRIPLSVPNGKVNNAWLVRLGAEPVSFEAAEPKAERRRHQRKYATGELGEDKSFYFRGPDRRLNLRAQNLGLFMQMADGVDDDTWSHHLKEHDVSGWFLESIKDEALAKEAAEVEADGSLSPEESRARIREAIQRRYAAPP
ncbi:MAG TPA: HAD-IIB family hydrolase [Gemmatimonadaceae bacterium]